MIERLAKTLSEFAALAYRLHHLDQTRCAVDRFLGQRDLAPDPQRLSTLAPIPLLFVDQAELACEQILSEPLVASAVLRMCKRERRRSPQLFGRKPQHR